MRALPLLLMLAVAGSGCLSDDGGASEPQGTDGEPTGTPGEPDPGNGSGNLVPVQAECKDAVNYGLMADTNGYIVYTGPDGPQDVRVYQDTNGK